MVSYTLSFVSSGVDSLMSRLDIQESGNELPKERGRPVRKRSVTHRIPQVRPLSEYTLV